MISLIEKKGYISNIRVKNMFDILPEIERINIYNFEGNIFCFKLYRKICNILGVYSMNNKIIMNYKVRKFKNKPLLISFSYDFCESYNGSVILDIDDPYFNEREIDIINSDNIKALVVTTNFIKEIYTREYNIKKDIYVIPTPISNEIYKIKPNIKNDKFVIGYYSTYIYESELITLEKLSKYFEIYEGVEIWIIGKLEEVIEAKNVKCFGYLNHDEMLSRVNMFDIGLYVRQNDLKGRLSVKLIEMMAMGIPIVSTNVSEAFCIEESSSGIVSDINNFNFNVEKLFLDQTYRDYCSKNGVKYSIKYKSETVRKEYINLIDKIRGIYD